MLKSSGPNIEPWGTPESFLFHALKVLFTRTCGRLFMKENAPFWKPYPPN